MGSFIDLMTALVSGLLRTLMVVVVCGSLSGCSDFEANPMGGTNSDNSSAQNLNFWGRFHHRAPSGATTPTPGPVSRPTPSPTATPVVGPTPTATPVAAPVATPTPAPLSTPTVSQANTIPPGASAGDLNIVSYGAVGDGMTDNQTAIQNALNDAAKKGVGVFIPQGTFVHSNTLTVNGVRLNGTGKASVVRALDGNNQSITMQGSGAIVANIAITTAWTGARLSAPWNTSVWINGATNFHVDHVDINGSASAGIFDYGGSHGFITNNTVENTLADSIHNTFQSSFIVIDSNHIENSGDDGVAVVSYAGDGGYVHDITATNNEILNNVWGRGMSVVGGQNVIYQNNYVNGNIPGVACLYLAAEPPSSYNTLGAQNVTAVDNTFENCGGNNTGHGAVMIWGPAESNYSNDQITIQNTLIKQQGQPGIVILGPNSTNISLINYLEQGQGSDNFGTSGQVIQNTPYSSGPVGYSPTPNGVDGTVPMVQ